MASSNLEILWSVTVSGGTQLSLGNPQRGHLISWTFFSLWLSRSLALSLSFSFSSSLSLSLAVSISNTCREKKPNCCKKGVHTFSISDRRVNFPVFSRNVSRSVSRTRREVVNKQYEAARRPVKMFWLVAYFLKPAAYLFSLSNSVPRTKRLFHVVPVGSRASLQSFKGRQSLARKQRAGMSPSTVGGTAPSLDHQIWY